MKKSKSSMRALLKSGLALLLCISMLIGGTYAWFTDEVTSSGNIIQSGNLDIDMQWAEKYEGDATAWNDAAGENAKPVFDYQNWEPGYTEVRYIKVTNEGNLAFKWLMNVIPVGLVGNLAKVIEVRYDVVSENPHFTEPTAENKQGSLVNAGTLADVIAGDETVVQGVLLPEDEEKDGFYSGEVIACISLHMREDAGNEYQGESIGDSFNILLKATQYTYEYDDFGNDYDKEATYPHITTDLELSAPVLGLVDENNRLTKEIILTDPPTGISATIPVGTIVDVDASQLVLKIVEDDVDANVTLDTRVGYDVEVIGVAFNNDKPIVIFMPKVLPAHQIGTQLFHAGKAMTRVYTVEALSQREGNNDTYGDKYIYDDNSGNVYFSLIHFSNVSLASTATVEVLGEEMAITGNTYDLKDYKGGTLTIPADGNVHLIQFTRDDKSSKNALDLTLTHTWHNLNPGEMSSTALKVEKGAKVVLSGVNIRTNSGVDALEIINPANVTENKVGETYIYVADGTQNWLTGKSGIGFGANSPNYVADIYVEGYGSLYTTAMGWGSPGIGVDSYSDGNQSKMHFSVGFLRSIPMNAAAGIGGGFAGQSWFCLKLIEFNGGTYHVYRGGDSASIGTGTNGDLGEIIINEGSTVNCYTNPWTAYGRDMGRGMYAGNCAGIYVSENAKVYGYSHKYGYSEWMPGHGYVPSGRSDDASVVVNGFSKITDLQAKINENGEVVSATATVGDKTVEIDPTKCKYSDGKVSVSAVYGKDIITGAIAVHYLKHSTDNTVIVDEELEVVQEKAEFLYRVGNQNNVTKAQIATMLTGKEHDGSNVDIAKHVGDAAYNGSKFNGTGLVKVTIDGKEYFLEVVNAYNLTDLNERHGNAGGKDWVLIKDLTYTYTDTITISNMTWYGNGFTVNFTNFDGAYDEVFLINANDVCLDNIQLVGPVYPSAYVFKEDANTANNIEYYRSLFVAAGKSEINNSFISGTRSPVRIDTGELTINNSTISGGNVANIDVHGGKLNLNNVTTVNQDTEVVGYGIFLDNEVTSATITIDGLTSYNWLTEDDIAKLQKTDTTSKQPMYRVLDSVLTEKSAVAVNFQIICLNTEANVVINGLNNGETAKIGSYEGRLWSETGTGVKPAPEYKPQTQGYTEPVFTWAASVADDSYNITVERGETGTLPANLLTATKYGNPLSVEVSGTTSFTEEGTYTVTYTITDTYNYDKDGKLIDTAVIYKKNLSVKVTVTEPSIKAPTFKLIGSNGATYTSEAGTVITITDNSNNVWVTLSAKADGFTEKKVNGITVYAPNVMGKMTDGYSKGDFNIYYPIFKGIEITDGENEYKSSFSGSSLPSGFTWVTDPNAADTNGEVYYMTGGKKWSSYGNSPTYGGFYRQTNAIGSTQAERIGLGLVEFTYKAADGITYHYCICFDRPQCNYVKNSSDCLAEGTMITMADGNKKAVEDIRKGETVMSFDHLTGKVTSEDVIIVIKIECDYTRNTFIFDDGSKLATINEHGIFDLDLNKYVNIDEFNYEQFVGHRFVSIDSSGNIGFKRLVDVETVYEHGYKYDIVTDKTLNYVAEDTLSVTHVLVDVINSFDFGDDLKYDAEKMQSDIAEYGLYTYDEWAEYCDISVFEQYNIPVMKVGISKGLYTKEYIIGLINKYVLNEKVQIID